MEKKKTAIELHREHMDAKTTEIEKAAIMERMANALKLVTGLSNACRPAAWKLHLQKECKETLNMLKEYKRPDNKKSSYSFFHEECLKTACSECSKNKIGGCPTLQYSHQLTYKILTNFQDPEMSMERRYAAVILLANLLYVIINEKYDSSSRIIFSETKHGIYTPSIAQDALYILAMYQLVCFKTNFDCPNQTKLLITEAMETLFGYTQNKIFDGE